MAFKINADKYAYSASPEKVSESYAAELAKKLVADEAEERSAGYAALENKIEIAAAEEAALRREADRVLDERISLEASTRMAEDKLLGSKISAEAEARSSADSLLRTDMEAEIHNKADKDHTHSPEDIGALPVTAEIPSKVSQLENDSGYLTEHQDISGKADKADTYTKTEIDNQIGDMETALDNIIAIQESLIEGTAIVGTDKYGLVDRITNKAYDLYISNEKLIIEEREG